MKKLIPLISILGTPFLSIPTHAQSAINSSGNTLKANNVSYTYSIGEVCGFPVKPYCSFIQGVVQVTYRLNIGETYQVSLYPNPTNDVVYMVTDYPDVLTYNIFSLHGQLVKSGKFLYPWISLKDLPAGLYLIQVSSSDNKLTKSFKISKN